MHNTESLSSGPVRDSLRIVDLRGIAVRRVYVPDQPRRLRRATEALAENGWVQVVIEAEAAVAPFL